jgi:hypothetical protein
MSNINNSISCTSALYRCEERLKLTQNKRAKISETYYNQYKRYLRWFDNNLNHPLYGLSPEPGGAENIPIYCTQHNVEQYFKHAVCEYVGRDGAAKSHFTSLQWANYHVEAQKGTKLIESPIITDAIRRQKAYHKNVAQEKYKNVDPHKGLRDLMPIEDTIKIVSAIYLHSPNAPDLAFSYLWGINAGVRGASSRALTMKDLKISYGYGPESLPPRNCTLMLIHRTGDVHKDRHTTQKQVGAQRHRNYKLCACFATGLLLIKRFNQLGNNLSFIIRKGQRPTWWDIPLNNYTNLNEETNAMEYIYNKSKVTNIKSTHHRTQCVQLAGARGLSTHQVSTMTKHKKDKLDSAYMPEAEEETLKVMSGFRKVSISIYFYLLMFYITHVHLFPARTQICS